MTKIKYFIICLVALMSCKKESKPGNSQDDTTTTGGTIWSTTITPQKDPAIAKSAGFFLDDWAAKTFATPAHNDVQQPTANATVTVSVDYSNVIAKVPKYLFGNNTNPYMGQMVT